jgi:hypothetical protein
MTRRPWNWVAIEMAAETGDPALVALRDALNKWAKHWFNSCPPWLMVEAAKTLQYWRYAQSPVVRLDWHFVSSDHSLKNLSPSSRIEVPFRFEHPGWQFWRQQAHEWIESVDEAYEVARDRYIQDQMQDAENLGHHRTNEVRKGSDWHIPAFVRFQILGESKDVILPSLRPRVNSHRQLHKVFGQIAKEAGLNLRREPSGPKPGTKNRVVGKRQKPSLH